MRKEKPESRWRAFYAVIARIPEGRVATYGQIAALAGLAGNARQVGYALAALPEGSALPWQRVINARGEVSLRSESGRDGFQRHLLQEEGVIFGPGGRVDLARYRWEPRRTGVPARGRGAPSQGAGKSRSAR
jgi:methylated-DNA-protein-cysteine methyltransferase-like protein